MNQLIELLLDMLEGALLVCAPFLAAASIWLLISWPLIWITSAMVLFIATWIFYGHLMNLGYELHLLEKAGQPEQLPAGAHQLAIVLKILGYFLDYLLNAMVFALILLRIPMEHTVTEALNRYGTAKTWRGSVARYFAKTWINFLDRKSIAQGKQHIEITEGP